MFLSEHLNVFLDLFRIVCKYGRNGKSFWTLVSDLSMSDGNPHMSCSAKCGRLCPKVSRIFIKLSIFRIASRQNFEFLDIIQKEIRMHFKKEIAVMGIIFLRLFFRGRGLFENFENKC